MHFKKIFLLSTIFIFLFTPIFSLAYDYCEDNNIIQNSLIETSGSISNIPNINARYAVILDRASEAVLYGKNENTKCKMASTTKIMTAIIVLENCENLDEVVTISSKSARYRWLSIRITYK